MTNSSLLFQVNVQLRNLVSTASADLRVSVVKVSHLEMLINALVTFFIIFMTFHLFSGATCHVTNRKFKLLENVLHKNYVLYFISFVNL